MARNDYRALLLKRMEKDFSVWLKKETLLESELYRFLHTMKGTSGTIGMNDLFDFCSAQIEGLSGDSSAPISIDSLKPFIASMKGFFNQAQDAQPVLAFTETAPALLDENSSFILVIDQDAEFASFIKELLEQSGIQVIIALTAKRGLELFYTLQPHMVLIDSQLPDSDSFRLLEQICDIARSKYVPIAITSTNADIDLHIKALETGAMDFITKPVNTKWFVPYVLNRLKNRGELQQFALTDELTGAGNRRQFNETLQHMALLAERKQQPFTLVMLDLDYFKKVNDQYGHPAGDHILTAFSQLIKEKKRDSDFFFRYGGEEFALLLPGTRPEEAAVLVERIRKQFSNMLFHFPPHEPCRVTFSAGAAPYRTSEKVLLSEADQALYQAKQGGRDKLVVYKADSKEMHRRLTIIIVDDDLLVRKMLSKQFVSWKPEDLEVNVKDYPDGPSFLETDWYKPGEHYMVLLDGIMPKMDGLEVLSILRSKYPDDNIIISMLTARINEADIVLALQSGADDYIVKPFHPQEVAARVQRLIKRLLQ